MKLKKGERSGNVREGFSPKYTLVVNGILFEQILLLGPMILFVETPPKMISHCINCIKKSKVLNG